MKRTRQELHVLRITAWLATFAMATAVGAMELEWTRMTGQYPAETGPLVEDLTGDGRMDILSVNRGGQLMLWAADGSPIGSGQDGTVATLPKGRWTTPPVSERSTGDVKILVCSVEGLVVCLDSRFETLWQYQLPAETMWGRAIPAKVETPTDSIYVYGDRTGSVTGLNYAGTVVWNVKPGGDSCNAPLKTIQLDGDDAALLVPIGSLLHCLDRAGQTLWSRDLGGRILSRPEVYAGSGFRFIVCGAGSGSLFGVSLEGRILWETALGDEIDTSIVFLPRPDGDPLILCTGLWGNLHALDANGRHVWTNLYRAKGRGMPLIADVDGDGAEDVVVTTYNQHIYQFDGQGNLVDEARLNGVVNSSPVALLDSSTGRTDVVASTASLLAYRVRGGKARSPYGETGKPEHVTLRYTQSDATQEETAIFIRNPYGALITTNVSITDANGWKRVTGYQTTRSEFEMPIPATDTPGTYTAHAVIRDENRGVLTEDTWRVVLPMQGAREPSVPLAVWAVPAYSTFDAERLNPPASGSSSSDERRVSVPNLYRGEIGQGAFAIASNLDEPMYARIVLERPVGEDEAAFGGGIVLRQVLGVPTVNGETAYDALPKLQDGGVITIPAKRAVKIWVSVDSRGAEPGLYRGKLTVQPFRGPIEPIELTLEVETLELQLPDPLPLTFCVWDYVPNNWFSTDVDRVLDDMNDHGVSIFPRSSFNPRGKVDAQGRFTMDWTKLDAGLKRFKGRGTILFQASHPSIEFAEEPTAQEKRKWEITHLRAWRDHLKELGWGYEDYAFYPLDEPGLHHGKNVPHLIEAGELFREADPKFRIYTDPVPGLSWKDFERIEPLIDVWCPNMRLVSGLLSNDPRIDRIMRAGKTVWSYECIAMVRSLSPLRYNRANAWRAKYFGLDGIGHWTFCTTKLDPWTRGKTYNDEFTLVYPGALPVPSMRWEAVRDGLEDVAAIALLEEQIERHERAGTERKLVDRAKRRLRMAQIDILELSDETFMESKDYLRMGDRQVWHTATDVRVYREHRAAIADLTKALLAD